MILWRALPQAFAGVAAVLATVAAAATEPVRYRSVVFAQVEVTRDVVFQAENKTSDSPALRLDVYKPAGDAEKARPAILWLHGGGLRPGRTRQQGVAVEMAMAFAKRGYVSVSADYRVSLAPDIDHARKQQDAADDVRAALAWMRAHAAELGVDPQRIAVGGSSTGGIISVIAAGAENAEAAKRGSPALLALVALWGVPSERLLSEIVHARFPPTLMVHGTKDQTVPFKRSEDLARHLTALDVRHTLVPVPEAGHTPVGDMPLIVEAVAEFLFESLKKQVADPR